MERIGKLKGKSTRVGVYKCYECRKPFTVKIGTIFEDSKLPLHVWLQAILLMAGSKKGISTHQLQRMLGVSIKTAWFLSQRLREGMREGDLAPLGGNNTVVEADECYIGAKKGIERPKGGFRHKMRVVTLIDRGSGRARSIDASATERDLVAKIVRKNVKRESRLVTDEARHYWSVGREFSKHESVMHGIGEYVRGDVYTNRAEGFFSVFKRGMRGVYQHCGERHLHRYLAEFDFRYNHRQANGFDDQERADQLLKGFAGRRLTYGRIGAKAA
jgi:hypothetical protein